MSSYKVAFEKDTCRKMKDLVIWPVLEHLPYRPHVPSLDFTIIGLNSENPVYALNGKKERADYTLDGKLAIRKFFFYKEDGIVINIRWYMNDGSVGHEKQFFKQLSNVQIEKLYRSQRDRAIVYLQANAKGTPAEPYVNIIIAHFKTEIDLFVQSGSSALYKAIEAEINPQILGILNTSIAPNVTIKDSIYLHILST